MSDKAKIWADYLCYLREWCENHSGAEFYEMSPACFDEWLCNEYEEGNNGET
jgi:hypothetical protein